MSSRKRARRLSAVSVALAAVVAAASLSPLAAQPPAPAFRGLTVTESAALERGEPVIREASADSLSLAVDSPFADEIRDKVGALGANYVGEVLMILDSADPAVLAKLAHELSDVRGYVGIPYWSQYQRQTYELFDRMKIIERSAGPDGATTVAEGHMKPFADYRARYSYELSGGELRFRSVNLSPISYKGFPAVGDGGMVWYLYAFERGGRTYLYAVGAVRAFDFFGIFGYRLRLSFMGRIESFFSYMYAKGTTTK
ncbi:MAG TPA: DUF6675 family protein [Rectinemataceae bacterium]|nr:DUF6675 family protein [Rectinemataceae bacterium]